MIKREKELKKGPTTKMNAVGKIQLENFYE